MNVNATPTPEETGGPSGIGLRIPRMVVETASLRARHHEKVATWQALFVPEITRRLRLDHHPEDPRPGHRTGATDTAG